MMYLSFICKAYFIVSFYTTAIRNFNQILVSNVNERVYIYEMHWAASLHLVCYFLSDYLLKANLALWCVLNEFNIIYSAPIRHIALTSVCLRNT